ncbi:MAG: RibD family protein [Gammaproteobacteria bacterium]|nr:RibD family protein [Gammaproteobacteria bacterium]
MNLNHQIECWLNTTKDNIKNKGRPFITLAYAQGLDGSITTRQGNSLGLSGNQSIQLTHQLRSLHDGILVGIETILTDDPRLTVREWQGNNPQPIVLDSQLRLPPTAKICNHPDKNCWILTLSEGSNKYNNNADVLTFEGTDQNLIPLEKAMRTINNMGITSLMVEGGATVITAFLKAKIADAIVLTITPWLIGGYKAVSDLGEINLSQLPSLNGLQHGTLDNDMIIYGTIKYGRT